METERWWPLLLGLASCAPAAPADVESPSPQPQISEAESDVADTAEPPPQELPPQELPPLTHADDAPWLELRESFSQRFGAEGWTPDPEVATNLEMREALCVDSVGDSRPCAGEGPWILRFDPYGDGRGWGHVVAVHQLDNGWLVSEGLGFGSLARCGASTDVDWAKAEPGWAVVVDDYFEFPEYLCVEGDEDDCDQWMGSCGEPVSTQCTVRLDPLTLETLHVEGECSAYDVGRAAGLDDG